jgi:DNA-binding MarR family transcriptional regulator
MTRQYMQLQISLSKLIWAHGFATLRRVTEVSAPTDPVAAWRELNAAHAAVHAALEWELKKEHDLTTIEFEVLERLAGCSDGKVRMSELAGVVHATQSTVSRVVARLEDEGLVCRAMCSDDRRGIFASLSPEGRERVEAAAPTYRRVIAASLPAPR